MIGSTRVPGVVKRAVHLGTRSYGWLTAGGRVLPSFLLCGGQRCGTTSLYRALAAHPAIRKAVLHKGVHYFDTGYHRGPRWYRGHFPRQRTVDRIADRIGVPPMVFESSPYYLYHPYAAARIARDLPEVRLIVLVRDPVARAASQHAHELARGFESEPSFSRALALEPARLRGTERLLADPQQRSFAHQHHAYRSRGEYVRYLDHLASLLPRDQILVLESAELFATPESAYARILAFLGLPHVDPPHFTRHNATRLRPPMPDRVRCDLTAHYQPFDTELARWLGHPPSWTARPPARTPVGQ